MIQPNTKNNLCRQAQKLETLHPHRSAEQRLLEALAQVGYVVTRNDPYNHYITRRAA